MPRRQGYERIRERHEQAFHEFAEALVAAEVTQEGLKEVLRTAFSLGPTALDVAAACVIIKALGDDLLAVSDHWRKGTKADLLMARRFVLAHQDYLGDVKNDMVSALHGRRSPGEFLL